MSYQGYSDEVSDYIAQWINQETWCDLRVALDSGDLEVASDMICNSGAIDSRNCFEHARETELKIEGIAKKFRKLPVKSQTKRYAKVFKETLIIDCADCNHHSFVADKNEELYPELKTQCWECGSKNINKTKGMK